ncbi:MAG: hypothetical protein HWN66_18620, partial [Candidatus Helarchaeota archaeon]|nr:hypothetical protein [Candidatus Helarchaeota archaeon]
MRFHTFLKFILLFFLVISPVFAYGLILLQNEINGVAPKRIGEITDGREVNLHTDADISSFNGRITGTGIPANVTLRSNINSTQFKSNSNTSLEIPVPSPGTITFTNITLSHIIMDTTVEDYMGLQFFEQINIENTLYAMQFNISSPLTLNNFSIFLYEIHKVSNVQVSVYNATLQGSRPAPHVELLSESVPFDLGGDNEWNSYNLSAPINLNPANTYDNAFFIAIYPSVDPGGKYIWGHGWDSGGVDAGAAYRYSAPSWTLEPVDFTLKIGFENMSRSPSQVDLRINGTQITDKNLNDGEWISTSLYSDSNGSVSFTFSANLSVEFFVEWFVSYNSTYIGVVDTNFEGFATDEIIHWNTSYQATFIGGSTDNQLEFTIPRWKAIKNVWKSQTVHNQWNWSDLGSVLKVTIGNASNGVWIIECNDTNYVEKVYIRRSGSIVSEVNSTDAIEIFGNLTEVLDSGDVNLTIFPLQANYNDTIGESISLNKTIKFSPTWTPANTSISSYSDAKLQVTWFNGTAAGINVTTLTVHSVPTKIVYKTHTPNLESGQSIIAYIEFFNNYTGLPMTNPSLLVKNSTDGTNWPAPFQISNDYLNGTYEIEILTLGVASGLHNFSINLSKPMYLSDEVFNLSVLIGGTTSNISVTAPNCGGLIPINQSYAIANPAPYHNASVKVTVYYFSHDTLEPLSNAIITGTWLGGGPDISWVPAFFGYYNITIDVTGFKSNTNHTLKISIQQASYTAADLYIIVAIKKLPTIIVPLETSYSHYVEELVTIFAVYEDVFNEESIPTVYSLSGNFTIKVGNLIDSMSLLSPILGLYKYDLDLSSVGLSEGVTYNITFCAFSSEHEFASLNVSLYIIPKAEVELTLLGMPNDVLAGTDFTVYANLTLKSGPPIIDVPVTFKVQLQVPGSIETPYTILTNGSGIAELTVTANSAFSYIGVSVEYSGNVTIQTKTVNSSMIQIITLNSSLTLGTLPGEVVVGETLEISATLLINGTPPEGEIVTFEFYYDGAGPIVVKTAGTDVTGTATVSLEVPSDVSTVRVVARYDGPDYVIGDTSETDVTVISFIIYILQLSPYWLPPIGAVVGTV